MFGLRPKPLAPPLAANAVKVADSSKVAKTDCLSKVMRFMCDSLK